VSEFSSTTYTLVQRRGSEVAHAVLARPGWRDTNTLCAQWAPGHSSWTVPPDTLPLCRRCAKKLGSTP
jgi:hypothetical protein